MKAVLCRNCNQKIWLVPDINTGRSRPVDPEDRLSRLAEDGNIVLVYPEGNRGPVLCRQLDRAELEAKALHHRHMPHQATCPSRQRTAA